MVAAKLTKYLNTKDGNGVVVASWATETSVPGVAKCKYCDCKVKYFTGKRDLTKHSETLKHITAASKANSTERQMSIDESLSSSQQKDSAEQELKARTEEFEISLARSLSNHKVSMQFIECLQSQLKKYCGDSKVVEKMSIQRNKAEVVVRQGIAPTYREETIRSLRECDSFSVGFDESEVNKTSELEVLVRISTSNGIELRHYRTIDLYSGSAEVIVKTLLEHFDEDAIDYRKRMLSTMTDGCNTMQGKNAGVKKRLSGEVPQFVDFGSCNDHHVSNALKAAVTAFDPDIQQALVNIYMDIGGAKGKGLKKKKEFEAVCETIGLKPQKVKKFSTTRFRGIRTCLRPVLHNWEGIVKYYSEVKKPTERQKLLKSYFVDREWKCLLNMTFVMAATRELDEAIDYFEKRSTLIHEIREKMEKILRSHILKFHNETTVKKTDDDETIEKKTGTELLLVDIDDKATRLSKRKVFVGNEVTELIKSFSLEPKSTQLSKFYENVFDFHRTVASKLMTYFETGLKCTELKYISAFSPRNFNAVTTSSYMKYLAQKFSKVVENIEAVEGIDKLKEEIDSYTIDTDIKIISCKSYEDFWMEVAKLEEGGSGWKKYPILPRFALALGTVFNSNSETERAFSVETDIHRNPKRNLMLQETFDAHMQVHFGVETKSSRDICSLCIKHEGVSTEEVKSKPKHHCHCSVAPIEDVMKETCRRKWALEKTRKALKKTETETTQEDKDKADKAKEVSTIRKLKFVTGLKTRRTFYSASLTSPVFLEIKTKKNKESQPTSTKAAVESLPTKPAESLPEKESVGNKRKNAAENTRKTSEQGSSSNKTLSSYTIPKKTNGGEPSKKKQKSVDESTKRTTVKL